ncbi:MAG: helix-turn-helix domain-containing protein [Methylococcales bacterium]
MTETIIPPLLTAKGVAARLSIPVSTLRKNVSANKSAVPPFIKLGKASNSPIRWRAQDVEDWLQEQFETSNAEQEFNFTINDKEVSMSK